MRRMFFKVIACEIAFREMCFAAARARNVADLEFLTQGHHDRPIPGRGEIQERINAVPADKYDAILLGYGLCSNILLGLTTEHTPLVVPRAHDCITFFLGSKERYQQFFASHPGTYYYTSGWLECRQRRGQDREPAQSLFMPAHSAAGVQATFEEWVKKYGEEEARYLMDVLGHWTDSYSHGVLIDFDFTQPLGLRQEVQEICAERKWQFEEAAGDLRLLQQWLDGDWNPNDFLVVQPREQIVATYDDNIIGAKPREAEAK